MRQNFWQPTYLGAETSRGNRTSRSAMQMWAIGHTRCGTGVLCPELSQECLGLLEVGGLKALSEPAVDRCQQLVRFDPLAVLLPQATQAHGRAQLPGFGLLAAGNGQGLQETGFGLGRIRDGLPQQEFTPEPIRLCEHVTP